MLGLALWICLAGADAPAFPENKTDLMTCITETGQTAPVTSPSQWEIRKSHLFANIALVMGTRPDGESRVPLDMRVRSETDCGGYIRKRIDFAVESWDRLPAWLLVPKNLSGPAPAVLCPHPTSPDGKDVVVGLAGKQHRNYAAELAERGYVTLAPDYPGFGEYVAARRALYDRGYASCSRKGIWNHRCCVDLLQSLPEVDGTRIGCIGHSLGGHNTLFAGLFDDRIKVMVTSCGFTAFPKYMNGHLKGWSHDGYMPRIESVYQCNPAKMPFDFTEIIAALVPRPVFVNAPLHDDNFDLSGVHDCLNAAMPVYALYQATDRLVLASPDSEHDFPDETRLTAYAFLDRYLKTK